MRATFKINNNVSIEVSKVIRWAKNGRKYVWNNPTQDQFNDLVKKYGIDQIDYNTESKRGVIWLQY